MRRPSYMDGDRGRYWDKAHEKDPESYRRARVTVFAPDDSDRHEITRHCVKTLDNNGAWDFVTEYNDCEHKNVITFKYNGTITAADALSELHFRCEHSIKWEFIG